MRPYFEERGITIWNCDCREILSELSAESIITDPVWPNSIFPGIANPQQLLCEALHQVAETVRRVTIHLGCDSDPRFLCAVPDRWPFIRVCDLDYAKPTYKGKIIHGGDIAYVFGDIPDGLGRKLLPGRFISTRPDKLFERSTWIGKDKHFTRRSDKRLTPDAIPHPCARRLQHVRWLVKWFGGVSVLDPFAGSGTTLLAAKLLGIPAIGIEIEERFCALAVRRLRQEVFDFQAVAL